MTADLTIAQVAEIMQVHPQHVRNLIDSRQLDAYALNVVGARKHLYLRVTRESLDRFRSASAVKPPATPRQILKAREYPRYVGPKNASDPSQQPA